MEVSQAFPYKVSPSIPLTLGTYLIGPTKDGEGKETRREPGVQHILIYKRSKVRG